MINEAFIAVHGSQPTPVARQPFPGVTVPLGRPDDWVRPSSRLQLVPEPLPLGHVQ